MRKTRSRTRPNQARRLPQRLRRLRDRLRRQWRRGAASSWGLRQARLEATQRALLTRRRQRRQRCVRPQPLSLTLRRAQQLLKQTLRVR